MEAKAWQAALQDARKLRGDTGPLSKFSIELLDEGYRAIDPVQKLSYLVNQAPPDAPLKPEVNGAAHGIPSSAPSAGPSIVPSPAIVPSPSVVPSPAIVPSPSIIASSAAPTGAGLVPSEALARPAPPRPEGPSVRPSPAPVSSPLASKAPEPPRAEPLIASFERLRRRSEEPTAKTPISYREEAYVVASGTERVVVEVLLRDRLGELQEELAGAPPGKLVQLAIFDHSFSDKPLRPPLGTLAWKDWRGEPVLGFPAFGQPAVVSPSVVPPGAVVSPPAPPEPAELIITEPEVVEPGSADPGNADPGSVESNAGSPEVPLPEILEPEVSPALPLIARTEAPTQSRAFSEPPQRLTPHPTPTAPRSSRPKLLIPRRRAGEDLIAELFEVMHELHFARDIAVGSEFVAGVLTDYVPSDVQLIQVFDIDQRKFVVVRAHGQDAERALLHATPGNDPEIVRIMRRSYARAERVEGGFKTGRFSLLKDEINEVLVGPVHQGGRYLGLIELANPLGGDPFHETEINALDYICEQFAEFLASRPIVLDPDVILGR